MTIPFDATSLNKTLFIIGSGRSGTTILQNALNSCPDIYLFGEAKFHFRLEIANARKFYNDMHRSFGNQETKSTYLPAFFGGDGPFDEQLRQLSRHYTYVGDKIAIGPCEYRYSVSEFIDFHSEHFFSSYNIFTFRAPRPTIVSINKIYSNVSIFEKFDSYLSIIELYIRMRRSFPRVMEFFIENADRGAFSIIENWLGVALPTAHQYYDGKKVGQYDLGAMGGDDVEEMLRRIEDLYEDLRSCRDRTLDQIEQHDRHSNNPHSTTLGRLFNNVLALRDELRSLCHPGK